MPKKRTTRRASAPKRTTKPTIKATAGKPSKNKAATAGKRAATNVKTSAPKIGRKASSTPKKSSGNPKTTKRVKPAKTQKSSFLSFLENLFGKKKEPAKTPTETNKTSTNKRKRKSSGFAHTKWIPHEKHPARFKHKNRNTNKIEYITFTHSDLVEMPNGQKVETIPLSSNINPNERGTLNKKGQPNISYVYPKVYEGNRDALGKNTNEYSLTKADNIKIEELFKTLPREKVTYTSNSKNKNKPKQ